MQLGETSESTELTQLHEFVGPPGSGAQAQVRPRARERAGGKVSRAVGMAAACSGSRRGAGVGRPAPALAPASPSSTRPVPCLPAPVPAPPLQPFAVTIDTRALLVMDFHAHLRRAVGARGSRAACRPAVGPHRLRRAASRAGS